MIAKCSRRMKYIKDKIDFSKYYNINDAISLLKDFLPVGFVESVDVAINLGIDARRSDQIVRGFVLLPNGIGRSVKVIAFTQGVNVGLAKSSGADAVGMDDLAYKVKNNNFKIDVVVATPDAMLLVSTLASILGPRGLMPNPRDGTVSQNIGDTIKNIKFGQIRFKNDKYGLIHATIGKISFKKTQLKENLESLILALKKYKPVQSKGIYIKKITISTTMGAGIIVDQSSLFRHNISSL